MQYLYEQFAAMEDMEDSDMGGESSVLDLSYISNVPGSTPLETVMGYQGKDASGVAHGYLDANHGSPTAAITQMDRDIRMTYRTLSKEDVEIVDKAIAILQDMTGTLGDGEASPQGPMWHETPEMGFPGESFVIQKADDGELVDLENISLQDFINQFGWTPPSWSNWHPSMAQPMEEPDMGGPVPGEDGMWDSEPERASSGGREESEYDAVNDLPGTQQYLNLVGDAAGDLASRFGWAPNSIGNWTMLPHTVESREEAKKKAQRQLV